MERAGRLEEQRRWLQRQELLQRQGRLRQRRKQTTSSVVLKRQWCERGGSFKNTALVFGTEVGRSLFLRVLISTRVSIYEGAERTQKRINTNEKHRSIWIGGACSGSVFCFAEQGRNTGHFYKTWAADSRSLLQEQREPATGQRGSQ